MGDKSTARETMKKAGVPTVPGSDGLLQVEERLSCTSVLMSCHELRLKYDLLALLCLIQCANF